MDPEYPTSKGLAAAFLSRVQFRVEQEIIFPTSSTACSIERDYNDRKAAQLLRSLSDLVFAEAQVEAWLADLGSTGCQV